MEEEGGKCIPVIDMQKLEEDDGEQQQQQQLKRLREASEEWGCFRIVNHKIPSSLMSEMKKVVREALDLPMEIKMRNTDVIAGSGYMAPTLVNPLYEALGLYDLASSQSLRTFSSQLDLSPHQRFLNFHLFISASLSLLSSFHFLISLLIDSNTYTTTVVLV